ncbi:MAG: FG-GAP repeat protein [Nitrospirota bacterium]
MTITNDDAAPTVSLTVTPGTLNEVVGVNGQATLTVSVSAISNLPTTVTFTKSGTAIPGTDYLMADEVTIPAKSGSSTVLLSAELDTLFEREEDVIVSLNTPTNGLKSTTTNTVTVKIPNNDPEPSVSITVATSTISETVGTTSNATSTIVTVTLNNVSGLPVAVTLAQSGVALNNTDYTLVDTITVPAGTSSTTTTLTAKADAIDEASENFTITLSGLVDALPGTPLSQQVTILDTNEKPNVMLLVGSNTITENLGSSTSVTAKIDFASSQDVVVTLTMSGNVTHTGALADYTLSNTITILAGFTTGTATLVSNDDSINEGNESVVIDITNVTNAVESGEARQTVTITDNDPIPSVQIFSNVSSVGEDAKVAIIRADLSQTSGLEIVVTLKKSGTAATSTADYTLSNNATITIPAGTSSAFITLTSVEDSLYEKTERATLTIDTLSASATRGTAEAVSVDIIDNELEPKVTLVVGNSTLSEANASTTLTFGLTGVSAFPVAITISRGGSATEGALKDYTLNNAITIPAGSSSAFLTLTVKEDTLNELNPEAVLVNIISATDADFSAVGQKTINITDNDPVPTVTLTVDKTTITENNEVVTVTATLLSVFSGQNVTVTLNTTGSTATTTAPNEDYTFVQTQIVILAGQSSASVTLESRPDTLHESEEFVLINISSIDKAEEDTSTPQQKKIIITDSSEIPTVTLAVSPGSISETGGSSTVTATLNKISGQNVTVFLKATGTATSADHTLAADFTIAIPQGSISNFITFSAKLDELDETDEEVLININTVTNASNAATEQKVTILDDDQPPVVRIETVTTPMSIAESGSGNNTTITVALDKVSGRDITVVLGKDGTAISGVGKDYTIDNLALTITAGQPSVPVLLTALHDTLDESPETVIVNIVSVTNATTSATQNTVTVTINDDDAPPVVSLSVADNGSISEENAAGIKVTASLDTLSGLEVVVTLEKGGAAKDLIDYNLDGTIKIPAGASTGFVVLFPINDVIDEGDTESAVFKITTATVTNGTPATTSSQVTVSIADNDTPPTVILTTGVAEISEPGGAAATSTFVMASLVGGVGTVSGRDVIVNLTFSGTPTSPQDYTIGTTTITIPEGQNSASTTLAAAHDTLNEGDEILTIDILSVTNGSKAGSSVPRAVKIKDNDDLPTVTLSVDPASGNVSEAATQTTVNVVATLSAISGLNVVVTLEKLGTSTALEGPGAGTDYTLGGSITVLAGDLSASTTLTVLVDTIDENSETIGVNILSTGATATKGTTTHQVVTIFDDDATPTVTLLGGTTISNEDGPTGNSALITAKLSAVSGLQVVVTLKKTGIASEFVTASTTVDYTATSTIIIPAGQGEASMTLLSKSDQLNEDPETVIIDIEDTGLTATEFNTQQETVTIADNDPKPGVSIAIATSSVNETTGTTSVTATLNALSGRDVTVTLGKSGVAIPGTDYTLGDSIKILTGQTTASITLAGKPDDINEGPEGATIAITSMTNADPFGAQSAATTIADDDNLPSITLSTGADTVNESAAQTNTIVTATLSAPSGLDVMVTLEKLTTSKAVEGTGANADYTLGGSITILAGTLSKSITLTVLVDQIDENPETINLRISAPINGTIGTTSTTTVTIADDDETPTVVLSVLPATINEGATSEVTATLSGGVVSGLEVQVNLAVNVPATDVAVRDTDYTLPLSMTIPAGQNATSVVLLAKTDNLHENSEVVTIDVTTLVNATTSALQRQTVTITNTNAKPTVRLSVSPSSISENGGVSNVTATLTPTSGLPVTVTLGFGGAASSTDFTATTTILIPAGESSVSVTLAPTPDTLFENDEIVTIDILSAGLNGEEDETQTAQVTIQNDDPKPFVILSAGLSNISEDLGQATSSTQIIVELRNAAGASITSGLPVTVTLEKLATSTATDGSGIASGDYNLATTTLTVPAGSTSTSTTLVSKEDDLDEDNETIVIDIKAVDANGTELNGTTTGQKVTVAITDNDLTPKVTLSVGSFDITEPTASTTSTTTVTATLTAISGRKVTVTLARGAASSATEGTDYSLPTTIEILAGNLAATTTLTAAFDTLDENNETVIIDINEVFDGEENNVQTQTVTIADMNAPPSVKLIRGAASVNEGENVSITAELSTASSFDVVVNLTKVGSIATEGTLGPPTTGDYALDASITVLKGNTTASIDLSAHTDGLNEADETVLVKIDTVTDQKATPDTAQNQVSVTITNTTGFPTVSLSVGTTTPINENGGTTTVTVTLNTVSAQDVTVTLTKTGTATSTGTADYTLANSILIPANTTIKTVEFKALMDDLDEAEEDVIITISCGTGSNCALGAPASKTLAIADQNPLAIVSLSVGSTSFAEGTGAGTSTTVTVSLDKPSAKEITVNLIVNASSTAVSPNDFTATSSIVIPAFATSISVTLSVVGDAIDEENETVIIELGTITNGTSTTVVSSQKKTVTINDDDLAPTVTLATDSDTVSEGGTVKVTVALSSASGKIITLDLNKGGFATEGATKDYTLATPITISIGATSTTATLSALADTLDENPETVEIVMANLVFVTASTTGTITKTVTIADQTEQPRVRLSIGSDDLSESVTATNTTNVTVTLLDLAGAETISGLDVTMTLGLGGSATGTDYTIGTTSIMIPAGTSTLSTVLSIADDSLNEPQELVVIEITGTITNGVRNSSVERVIPKITDNDPVPTVTLEVGTTTILETNGSTTVTAKLDTASSFDVKVTLSKLGTAGDADYTLASTEITILAGTTTGFVTLTAKPDTIFEGDTAETVILTIISVLDGKATIGTTGNAHKKTVGIIDDDPKPAVTLTIANNATSTIMAENEGSGTTITATLSSTASVTVTVNLMVDTVSSTASANDYTLSGVSATTTATITITPNTLSNTVNMAPVNDSTHEPSETVVVKVSSVTNGSFTATNTVMATITDNDTQPDVSLLIPASSINENAAVGTATTSITATLTAVSGFDVVVNLSFGGSASSTDYEVTTGGVATSSIKIPAGTQSVGVLIGSKNDTRYEGNETIVVSIGSSSSANSNSGLQTSITLTEDDAKPVVTLSLDSLSLPETGSSTTIVSAILTPLSDLSVEVTLAKGGEASEGLDYTLDSTTITILAGQDRATTTLRVIDDTLDEADNETLIISIDSVGTNGQMGDPITQTANIVDNDAPPQVTLTVSANTINEETPGNSTTIKARLSALSSKIVTVNLSYVGGTASTTDFTATSSIVIPVGTQEVTAALTATTDLLNEANETVIVSIASVDNGTTADSQAKTVTITDTNDPLPLVTLSVGGGSTDVSINENGGTTTVTATLNAPSGRAIRVNISADNATSTAASTDYTLAAFIDIPVGATTTSVTLASVNEGAVEANEKIFIVITSSDFATVSAPKQRTVTLLNDDAPNAPTMASSITIYGIKTLDLSWSAGGTPQDTGIAYYEIFEDKDGAGTSLDTKIGQSTGTTQTVQIPVHLMDWVNMRFKVKACTDVTPVGGATATACSALSTTPVSPNIADLFKAVGFLKATDSGLAPSDQAGASVSISGDTKTIAIGAIKADKASPLVLNSGAVYILTRDNAGAWTQEAILTAGSAGTDDDFGYSVSLSDDGNRLAVGAQNEDSSTTGVNTGGINELATSSGAVYVFKRTDTSWAQEAYVKASNTGAGDQFGSAVSISGDGLRLAVGASAEDSNGTGTTGDPANNSALDAGAAYVFAFGASWTQEAYVKSSASATTSDLFGSSVALDQTGALLAVGAPTGAAIGFVDTYTRAGTTWSSQTKLTAAGAVNGDQVGQSVSLSDDGLTLAVGAPGTSGSTGKVYVYTGAPTWGSVITLPSAAATTTPAGGTFGRAVSLNGDGSKLAVGANTANKAYVFTFAASSWTQSSVLQASNGGAFGFGFSVSLSDHSYTATVSKTDLDTNDQGLVVGAPFEDSNLQGVNLGTNQGNADATDSGAGYLY